MLPWVATAWGSYCMTMMLVMTMMMTVLVMTMIQFCHASRSSLYPYIIDGRSVHPLSFEKPYLRTHLQPRSRASLTPKPYLAGSQRLQVHFVSSSDSTSVSASGAARSNLAGSLIMKRSPLYSALQTLTAVTNVSRRTSWNIFSVMPHFDMHAQAT